MGARESRFDQQDMYESAPVKRVMVVGSTGEGKSSLINLLVGKPVAAVSDSARGCTFDCDDYRPENPVNYILSDTAGFNEGTSGTVSHKDAIKKLVRFARSRRNGFNLFVFVLRKGRLTRAFEATYNILHNILFAYKIPCILYVGHCEHDAPMDQWYKQNASAIHEKFRFAKVVCGTTMVSPNPLFEQIFAPMREETKKELWTYIKSYALFRSIPIPTESSVWKDAINATWRFFTSRNYFMSSTAKTLAEELRVMGMDDDEITDIIRELE